MKEKLPGLFRPLMKFNVTAVMVIILMFSVFNVFSIVRTQQRQASLQTMALSQASQQIGDFIASAEQLGIVVQNAVIRSSGEILRRQVMPYVKQSW